MSEPFRFSTEDVPEHDRLAVWREVLGRVHLHLDIEPAAEGPVRATVESHRWARTSLYFSDTTPVRASRTPEFVQDGDGDFRLLRADGAAFQFTANGVDEIVPDGGAALLFNGVVSSVRYLGPCRVTSVRLPRIDLAASARTLEDRPIRPVTPGSPVLGLIAEYTAMLRRTGPTCDPALASAVAGHLTDLVALAVGAGRDAAALAQTRGVRAARLVAVKAAIAARLSDPALSADMLAAQQGVTARYVRRLFEGEGLSLSEFVVGRRLARAHQMLCDAGCLAMTISAIAFACGFGDLSYFNRTFRRRYGMTPSDVRQRAAQGAEVDATS
jgi:AraC-like DNA-binding protein